MECEEKDLIEQLKRGEEKAYRQLFEEHYTILCDVAYQYLRDTFSAQSIAGDVIFHLWETREALEITTSLRSYLVRAVRNRSLDYLKSKHERHEITFSSLVPDGIDPDDDRFGRSDDYPLGRLLEQELDGQIRGAICRLPDECKRVFLKSRFENKKYEEIADELHISVNTVKYHMKNALAQLQQALGKYLATP